ncbi:MAG: STAS domain-containing protein [Acidobacteriaceae bacterium]|nr:STAS domain-containing protein [Acidobacteriaceae bacterium]MBV8569023.1 STAS domain-containing protein [Acidobacteriaceae bacterium]
MVGFTPMEISHTEIAPDTVVISISGKVMMGPQSEEITNLVGSLLHQAKRNIVFDLSGITNIDSTGIGRFISSYNQIAAVSGQMRMAAAPTFLARAFHVCRLDTIFRFYPSVEEACQGR